MYNPDSIKEVREQGWLHSTVGGELVERHLVPPPGWLQKVGNTGLGGKGGGVLEGPLRFIADSSLSLPLANGFS